MEGKKAMYEVTKYKNTYGIYCNKTGNFLTFGKKKDLIKVVKDLNESEKQNPTKEINEIKIDWFYE